MPGAEGRFGREVCLARKAIITGGAGFIGSHLCARLLEDGHEVYALDNLATGDSRNIEPLEGNPRFHFRLHDVTVSFDVGPIDRIYHLAGTAPGPRDPHHGVDIVLDSVVGTQHALRLAKQYEARFVLASSRAVYGVAPTAPQSETDAGAIDPRDPRSAHSDGKRAAEALVVQFARAFSVDARIARIFDTYGPRMAQDDAHPVATLVDQALRGGPLVFPSVDPDEGRSYCHVDDLVDGMVALMEGVPGVDPVNLGHPDPVTFRELAREVAAAAGLIDAGLASAEPPTVSSAPILCPRLDEATTRLGFWPRIDLRAGLAQVVDERLAQREGTAALARTA